MRRGRATKKASRSAHPPGPLPYHHRTTGGHSDHGRGQPHCVVSPRGADCQHGVSNLQSAARTSSNAHHICSSGGFLMHKSSVDLTWPGLLQVPQSMFLELPFISAGGEFGCGDDGTSSAPVPPQFRTLPPLFHLAFARRQEHTVC
jgi:hypothetical protein